MDEDVNGTNKGDTGGEVLIERAGKFELLNTNDMRADHVANNTEPTVKEEDLTKQNATQVAGQKSAESVVEDIEVDNKTSEELATRLTKVENESKSEAASRTPVRAPQSPAGFVQRRSAGANRSRTKSAPGARTNDASQEAFDAWLAKKNEEIIAQRKEDRAKQNIPTPEEIRRKREEIEASFQAWLAKKKKQIEAEKAQNTKELSRPSTGHTRKECSEAFIAWLDAKRLHELEKHKNAAARLRQEQEEASKVNPDLANQAYIEWLRRKKKESMEEAEIKREFRKSYASDSKRLKHSLALRISTGHGSYK